MTAEKRNPQSMLKMFNPREQARNSSPHIRAYDTVINALHDTSCIHEPLISLDTLYAQAAQLS